MVFPWMVFAWMVFAWMVFASAVLTPVLVCVVLMTGAFAVVLVDSAASTGAARTEAASRAAEIVFNMVVSCSKWISKLPAEQAGLVDHADDVREPALNAP